MHAIQLVGQVITSTNYTTERLKSETVRTIPLQLSVFFSKFSAEWSSLFAILSIAIVPMIVLFVVMQRSFIGGLTAGAVKL